MAGETLGVVNGVLLHLRILEVDGVSSFDQRLDFADGISELRFIYRHAEYLLPIK